MPVTLSTVVFCSLVHALLTRKSRAGFEDLIAQTARTDYKNVAKFYSGRNVLLYIADQGRIIATCCVHGEAVRRPSPPAPPPCCSAGFCI